MINHAPLLTDEEHERHLEKLRDEWYVDWMKAHGHSVITYPNRYNLMLYCSECHGRHREMAMIYIVATDKYVCKDCEGFKDEHGKEEQTQEAN